MDRTRDIDLPFAAPRIGDELFSGCRLAAILSQVPTIDSSTWRGRLSIWRADQVGSEYVTEALQFRPGQVLAEGGSGSGTQRLHYRLSGGPLHALTSRSLLGIM